MQTSNVKATDYKKWVGSFVILIFAIIALLRWKRSGELFFLLLFFRDILASFFLVNRIPSQLHSSKLIAITAYISSGLPLLYFSEYYMIQLKSIKLIANILAIIGFFIATWAMIDLGKKIGVSPAKRGSRCTKGLYHYIKHPMYLGYAIAQVGWVVINSWNIGIYILSLILFFIRSKEEDKLFCKPVLLSRRTV